VRLSYKMRPLGSVAWSQALDRVHEHLASSYSPGSESAGKLCVVDDPELYAHLELDRVFAQATRLLYEHKQNMFAVE
jgi:hypothetical protein